MNDLLARTQAAPIEKRADANQPCDVTRSTVSALCERLGVNPKSTVKALKWCQLVEPAIGPTVTASSVMLAAYGSGYSALKGEIEGGSNAGTAAPDTGKRKAQRSKVNGAFLTAGAFSAFALIVFAVLLKPAVNEVQDAFRVDFSFSDYSALDVMFVS
jgi:hypothetical protein